MEARVGCPSPMRVVRVRASVGSGRRWPCACQPLSREYAGLTLPIIQHSRMASTPRLLYHELLPATYPTSDGSENVVAVRFTSPVRLDSLRIHPEGVATLGGIGSTFPDTFTARILLNTSTSDPVNALAPSVIDYDGRDGWSQDYALGMPLGVSTRMVLIIGKFDRLSLSIYGSMSDGSDTLAREVDVEGERTVHTAADKEDWSWVSDWAGGTDGLLDLLDESVDSRIRHHALSCLELAVEANPFLLDSLISHPTALAYLLLLPSFPPQPILKQLFGIPKYALHSDIIDHLPPNHALRPLAEGTTEERRQAAWTSLPAKGSLVILQNLGPGDWETEVAGNAGLSRLAKMIQVLQAWQGSWSDYEATLDIIHTAVDDSNEQRIRYLASKLPGLIVKSRLHGSRRVIPIPTEYAEMVLSALLAIPPTIDGIPSFAAVAQLADPYLPFEPFTNVFTTPPRQAIPHTEPLADPEERPLDRFARSLDGPLNGFAHSLTPAQLVSVLAPQLLVSLSTAAQPPLGISPSAPMMQNGSSASASAFAGKVYSSHEFRTREPAHPAGPVAGGVAALVGESSGGGLGVGTARASRPASKHVDAFA